MARKPKGEFKNSSDNFTLIYRKRSIRNKITLHGSSLFFSRLTNTRKHNMKQIIQQIIRDLTSSIFHLTFSFFYPCHCFYFPTNGKLCESVFSVLFTRACKLSQKNLLLIRIISHTERYPLPFLARSSSASSFLFVIESDGSSLGFQRRTGFHGGVLATAGQVLHTQSITRQND
jgi:hypothetical protein